MLVRELIEILSDLDPEAEVILSTDEEGNSFEICDGVGEDKFEGEDGDPVSAIVLWPSGEVVEPVEGPEH